MTDDTFGIVTEANALHGQEHAQYLSKDIVESMKKTLDDSMKKLNTAKKNKKRKATN